MYAGMCMSVTLAPKSTQICANSVHLDIKLILRIYHKQTSLNWYSAIRDTGMKNISTFYLV